MEVLLDQPVGELPEALSMLLRAEVAAGVR
jgi:hypothetical protein